MPGGVHIVLEGVQGEGQKVIAMGCRCSVKKNLFFVFSPGAGLTRQGAPYEMKFATDFLNVGVCYVNHPHVISKYFNVLNCIYVHNHVHQSELVLEKCWVTQDPYFRLHTTIIKMNVADCWKLVDYHG